MRNDPFNPPQSPQTISLKPRILNDNTDMSVCPIPNLSGHDGRKRTHSANKFLKDVLARSVKCFPFDK